MFSVRTLLIQMNSLDEEITTLIYQRAQLVREKKIYASHEVCRMYNGRSKVTITFFIVQQLRQTKAIYVSYHAKLTTLGNRYFCREIFNLFDNYSKSIVFSLYSDWAWCLVNLHLLTMFRSVNVYAQINRRSIANS